MGVEIEGLEFQVETKVGKGVEGIDKLSKSLSRLKGALKESMELTVLQSSLKS